MHVLARAEEIVLMAIWKLQGKAYGVNIREQVLTDTGYEWSIGAIYAPLHRLEKKGLVSTTSGAPLPERGGRSRVYYQVTPSGLQALKEIRRVTEALWNNAPDLGLDQA